MINVQRKTALLILVVITMLGLSACSSNKSFRDILLDTGSVKYEKNQSVRSLEVPPDLTAPEFDEAFKLPSGVISAVSIQNKTTAVQSQSKPTTPGEFPAGFRLDASKAGKLARVRKVAGRSVLQVNDTYARSLVLTEVMLARLGFKTVRKSKDGGIITAVYNGKDVTTDGRPAGILNKLLDVPDNNIVLANGKSYDISIMNEQGLPTVRFARTNKKRIPNSKHAKMVDLLNKTFNWN